MKQSDIAFEKGKKYRVIYRIPGVQRFDRYMVATFIAQADTPAERDAVSYLFNARPAAGTQELGPRHIRSYEEVPMETPCAVNRRA